MDIFSGNKAIVSDVINRVLNCREIDELHVIGGLGEELAYLYPTIHVIEHSDWEDITGEAVYIRITNKEEFAKWQPLIMEEKESKDFMVYVIPEAEISDQDLKILGTPHYLENYSGLPGVLLLVGVSFQMPRRLMVPDDFRVLAVIHFYNEADILEKTIQYLLKQGIDLYLLDNWSDDTGYEIAKRYREMYPEQIYLEQFPLTGKSNDFVLYDQMEKTEQISKEMDYDWFIHYDADEMRVSPWENITLREAIYWIDRQGYNCIENTVIDFRLTAQDADNIFMKDTFFDFRHEDKMLNHLKTWKKAQKVDLKTTAGHCVHIENPKVYPLKFLNRHYPLRSLEQAEKKVFRDRLPRFQKEHKKRGWHGHYNEFEKAEDFIFDSSELLYWREDSFRKLYIPLFLECGLRWDVNKNLTKIESPNIEDQRIILYGAGHIGRRICLELAKKNQIVGWIDKQFEILPAVYCKKAASPQELLKVEYDYVFLAVKNAELIQEIREEITSTYGVPEEKILHIKCTE